LGNCLLANLPGRLPFGYRFTLFSHADGGLLLRFLPFGRRGSLSGCALAELPVFEDPGASVKDMISRL
jgi:hypothetical protein